MQKSELISLLVVRGVGQREELQVKTVEQLEKLYDASLLAQIRQDAVRQFQASPEGQEHEKRLDALWQEGQDLRFQQFFRAVVINGKNLVECESNRQVLLNLLDGAPLDNISARWLLNLVKQNPSQFAWQDIVDPRKQAQADKQQLAADREKFESFCRTSELIAPSEANFNLVREVLGPGLNGLSFITVLPLEGPVVINEEGDTFQLTPASQEEVQQWRFQRAKDREQFLIYEATPDQLRAAVRAEGAARQQGQAEAQAQAALEFEQARDKASGFDYPPLPELYDATKIKRMSKDELKSLMRRYGSASITARVQGKG